MMLSIVKKYLSGKRVVIEKMSRRNRMLLSNKNRVVHKNCVNLHWWSRCDKNGIENFGDALSPAICKYMLDKKGLSFDKNIDMTKHLYAVGSIIQGGLQNATVWGSGLKMI